MQSYLWGILVNGAQEYLGPKHDSESRPTRAESKERKKFANYLDDKYEKYFSQTLNVNQNLTK